MNTAGFGRLEAGVRQVEAVSVTEQKGLGEAKEKADTQETYWAGDSVWIYSMS